jgi:hypothetical protein
LKKCWSPARRELGADLRWKYKVISVKPGMMTPRGRTLR